MWYALLADVVVAVHVAYVGFVLLGQLAILLGLALHWDWVRNRWFRLTHLAAILVVAFEAIVGIDCPLTVWEYELRALAGQQAAEGTFIGRILHDLLFYQGEPWIFTTCYILFALLVLATFVFAPPRWRRSRLPATKPVERVPHSVDASEACSS